MTKQLALFGRQSRGRARSTDPDTSHIAAARVDADSLEGRVLQALRAWPAGLTTRELSRHTGIELWSLSPRLKPLREKGLVVDSGERDRSASGRSQIVWKAREGKP